ncbi:hypothetical protein NLG97_g3030 [Lecanicillium saksenae]|uniref:Uncharacterized protein n=1 Tax=Lecanicillium saksenae TaxID=468837 RepID=A0ACC1QZA8_9HYPO|nr:hypothetical protein NLG97_g3030 [Lecanicillium saksenae]
MSKAANQAAEKETASPLPPEDCQGLAARNQKPIPAKTACKEEQTAATAAAMPPPTVPPPAQPAMRNTVNRRVAQVVSPYLLNVDIPTGSLFDRDIAMHLPANFASILDNKATITVQNAAAKGPKNSVLRALQTVKVVLRPRKAKLWSLPGYGQGCELRLSHHPSSSETTASYREPCTSEKSFKSVSISGKTAVEESGEAEELPLIRASVTVASPDAAISSPASSIPSWINYPNPGYLGASSHVAIFSQLSHDEVTLRYPTPSLPEQDAQLHSLESSLRPDAEIHVAKVAECMKRLFKSFPAAAFKDLITFWRATGANLTLAGPLVDLCIGALDNIQSQLTKHGSDPYVSYARKLLWASSLPLPIQPPLTLQDFCSQSLGSDTRLEIVGVLICAVIRASSEVHIFPPLYLDGNRRQELMALAVKLTDASVEATLSFDMLNDLQLMIQYENFISYTYVYGVQSYYSYRKLGDVITSIVTLGYHEKLTAMHDVPGFLVDIRRTALLRAYSADKNWSIFLGRPPRLSKKFCHLSAVLRQAAVASEEAGSPPTHDRELLCWDINSSMSIWAETRWTAACAALKEEILDIFIEEKKENLEERVRNLWNRTELQWTALPSSFRMDGSLKNFSRGAWEWDFLASTRLGYLHVLFLLRLLCLGSPASPDAAFVAISKEILSLVVEVIVLRNQLVCSTGTSFEWRLAHYGLPAIGIIMLAMLKKNMVCDAMQEAQVIRDLGIVVTEVDLGTIVRPMEPNYALLSRATDTIKKFLVRFYSQDRQATTPCGLGDPQTIPEGSFWSLEGQLEPWDFEMNFWDNLAEHPSMFYTSS